MKTYLLRGFLLSVCIYFFIPQNINGQENNTLVNLNKVIKSSLGYDKEKILNINSIKKTLLSTNKKDLITLYYLNEQLFQEYKVFKRDSAFHYALRAKKIALKINDNLIVNTANINLADISVSAGMYKEAFSFLESINPVDMPKNYRSLYYGLMGRCYGDMAEYNNIPNFYLDYKKQANYYREKALENTDENTFFNSFLRIFNKSKNNQTEEALDEFKYLLQDSIGIRDKALVNYMVGDLYLQLDKSEQAINYFAKAVISDIKTSAKESLAIIKLSEILFKKGDIKNASVLIHKANEDALFYGAQQRKIQVGAILPLIEQEMVLNVEKEKERLYWQNIIISLFLLFVLCFFFIIYMQYRKLKKAKKEISEAHTNLEKINIELTNVNKQIKEHNLRIKVINENLLESNKIKEEYLGFFFTQYDDIFEKLKYFRHRIEKCILEENFEKAKRHVANYNIKKEKEKVLLNFDDAFMKLFPNFINEFNSLMKDEYKVKLKNERHLSNELRIFALIRLGVKHNEIIAQILGYSVNSIYAYKTKIRNRAIVDKNDFDQNLLEITTLKL
ncbi:DUF6377 domain-containing protein [uncultured Lutibacter sp.]|uniref:DUF6377 domain-containing protein n=1 Tax=uncultured Lutibacter sp. TaxID=437739 RepID=UPI00262142D1|nr:DUF6377 domain-containing protein [uncultured Lutibacter sp.]